MALASALVSLHKSVDQKPPALEKKGMAVPLNLSAWSFKTGKRIYSSWKSLNDKSSTHPNFPFHQHEVQNAGPKVTHS